MSNRRELEGANSIGGESVADFKILSIYVDLASIWYRQIYDQDLDDLYLWHVRLVLPIV